MKIIIILISLISFSVSAKVGKQDIRSLIGPTAHAPIKVDNTLYFLSTTGGIFKSTDQLKTAKLIGKTDMVTVSPITKDGDFFYFGEGLHDNKKTSLYKFNYKKEKIVKKISIAGHIQRALAVESDFIYAGLGHDGVAAFDKDLNLKWSLKKHKGKELHVDANPIIYKKNVCVSSIYNYKGILCIDKETGKVVNDFTFKENPKSELGLHKNLLYGLTTEADLMKVKFDIKSHLYVIDLDKMKQTQNKELRGYNFFKFPVVDDNNLLVNLSTGDFIKVNLKDGKVEFIGDFPEPFVSTPFMLKNEYCTIGIMGKILCYEKGKTQYHITKDKRYFESPVGTIKVIDGQAYVPSRMGFFKIGK